MQNIITKTQVAELESAGMENQIPLVKLSAGHITWLVTCIDNGYLWGYADAGMGCVEWCSLIKVDQLDYFKVGWAPLANDRLFKPNKNYKMEDYYALDSLSENIGESTIEETGNRIDFFSRSRENKHKQDLINQQARIDQMKQQQEDEERRMNDLLNR
jgi:hypothetical protein